MHLADKKKIVYAAFPYPNQEPGAAASIIGCKLLTIPHRNGKVTPETMQRKLKSTRALGKHSS